MRFLIALSALLLDCNRLYAQACQQLNVATDTQKRELLREYIQTCYQRHFFFKDKGAVKLITYQDAEGRPCWLLSALVDDQYRASLPAGYARFGNDVILVYQGNTQGTPLPRAGNPAGREACLREVLGGRVYHCTQEPQYTIDENAPGGPKKIEIRHITGGNADNSLIIKFNKDGTITKLTPV